MTQTFVEKELAAARSRLERTWDRLIDRRERKLEEVDQIERQINADEFKINTATGWTH